MSQANHVWLLFIKRKSDCRYSVKILIVLCIFFSSLKWVLTSISRRKGYIYIVEINAKSIHAKINEILLIYINELVINLNYWFMILQWLFSSLIFYIRLLISLNMCHIYIYILEIFYLGIGANWLLQWDLKIRKSIVNFFKKKIKNRCNW